MPCSLFCLWIRQEQSKIERLSREVLLKGKAQYSWPPITYYFRWAHFYFENIIYIFYKTSYLDEEDICTEPSFQLVFPGLSLESFFSLVSHLRMEHLTVLFHIILTWKKLSMVKRSSLFCRSWSDKWKNINDIVNNSTTQLGPSHSLASPTHFWWRLTRFQRRKTFFLRHRRPALNKLECLSFQDSLKLEVYLSWAPWL